MKLFTMFLAAIMVMALITHLNRKDAALLRGMHQQLPFGDKHEK